MTDPAPDSPVQALAGRLRAVAPILAPDLVLPADGDLAGGGPVVGDGVREAVAVLDVLARRVRAGGDAAQLWLLLAATTGTLPLEEQVVAARRAMDLEREAMAVRHLVAALGDGGESDTLHGVQAMVGGCLVDAGHTALSDLNTGIQRTVRETYKRWHGQVPAVPVAWSHDFHALRTLSPEELWRVTAWDDRLVGSSARGIATGALPSLVLPWRCTVFLPELPPERQRVERLRALARWSGNRLVVLGYDCIPMSGAEAVSVGASDVFAHFLSAVKHAARVVAISEAAATEFRGFARMVRPQGLPGPEVLTCVLPTDVPPPSGPPGVDADEPLVLSVGTLEPRKNQLAVLHAAERLWRRGLRFRLVIVGKAGASSGDVVAAATALQARGRALELRTSAGDSELWQLYRQARFTVFVSQHEGYGLPVAESLASGTPVLTTSYGSTAEIALDGGALVVDPRDEPAVCAAMARLLEDDALIEQLRAAALARPVRTWDDYATELWRAVGHQESADA